MATIDLTPYYQPAGTGADGTKFDNALALLQATLNALDNNNIAGGAAIAQSKLALDGWQAYTPAWTSAGVAPALGNGTITGRYVQLGKFVHCQARLTMGSTTTYGTGSYFLSLPGASSVNWVGFAMGAQAFDSSASSYYLGGVQGQTSTTVGPITLASPAVAFGQLVPFTWAVSDILSLSFAYEAA